MRRLVALAGVALCMTACGGSGPTGVLTGEIRYVGGLTPRGGIGPKAGRVTVFTTSGLVVARQRVGRAQNLRYRFVLRPGDYLVRAGLLVEPQYPWNCRSQPAHIKIGGTTEINVYEGCGIE